MLCRAAAGVFTPREVGQQETGCHGVPGEVDEPMGEVARDGLAEM